jgi:group I intron endonuclease
MDVSGIYQIQSVIKPGRIYIGSATNIRKRWLLHVCQLRNNKHVNKKLQRHFNKYGELDIKFTILITCEKNALLDNEQFFLDSYNVYFNFCKIAGSTLGQRWKLSDELKLKISNRLKGHKLSEETKNKIEPD